MYMYIIYSHSLPGCASSVFVHIRFTSATEPLAVIFPAWINEI